MQGRHREYHLVFHWVLSSGAPSAHPWPSTFQGLVQLYKAPHTLSIVEGRGERSWRKTLCHGNDGGGVAVEREWFYWLPLDGTTKTCALPMTWHRGSHDRHTRLQMGKYWVLFLYNYTAESQYFWERRRISSDLCQNKCKKYKLQTLSTLKLLHCPVRSCTKPSLRLHSKLKRHQYGRKQPIGELRPCSQQTLPQAPSGNVWGIEHTRGTSFAQACMPATKCYDNSNCLQQAEPFGDPAIKEAARWA